METKEYKCNFCDKTGMSKKELYEHLKDAHPKPTQNTTIEMKEGATDKNFQKDYDKLQGLKGFTYKSTTQNSTYKTVKPETVLPSGAGSSGLEEIDAFVEDNLIKSYAIAGKVLAVDKVDAGEFRNIIVEIMRERQALYTTKLIQKERNK